MKNTAATVGIVPLAGMAKVLEDAARNNEQEIISSLTPIFLKRWRSYKDLLADYSGKVDGKKDGTGATEDVEQLLQQVREAAQEMDIDELDRLWSELEQYEFPEEQAEYWDKIHKAILDFNIEFLQTI